MGAKTHAIFIRVQADAIERQGRVPEILIFMLRIINQRDPMGLNEDSGNRYMNFPTAWLGRGGSVRGGPLCFLVRRPLRRRSLTGGVL